MTTLKDLVWERMAELADEGRMDYSTRGLERLTGINNETCRRLLRGPYNPTDRTLTRLSTGLGLPIEQLREAAGQHPGYGPVEWPADADLLTPRQRTVVLELIALLVEETRKSARDDDAPASTEEDGGEDDDRPG